MPGNSSESGSAHPGQEPSDSRTQQGASSQGVFKGREGTLSLGLLASRINSSYCFVLFFLLKKIFFCSPNIFNWSIVCLTMCCSFLLIHTSPSSFYFYFWLCWVFIAAPGLLLVAERGGGCPLSSRLLIAVGFSGCGAPGQCMGLAALTPRGIFLDPGSNPCPLHGGHISAASPGKPS